MAAADPVCPPHHWEIPKPEHGIEVWVCVVCKEQKTIDRRATDDAWRRRFTSPVRANKTPAAQ